MAVTRRKRRNTKTKTKTKTKTRGAKTKTPVVVTRPVVAILFVLGCGHITASPAGGWKANTLTNDLAARQACPTCNELTDADFMYREEEGS